MTKGQIAAARRDPLSFRYSLGRGANVSHKAAASWLEQQLGRNVLEPVGPAVFVYRQSGPGFTAAGLIADVSLDAYSAGRVERHEKTFAKTEKKMADYMRKTRVLGNPVALGHRPDAGVAAAIESGLDGEPEASFTTIDGLSHELWSITDDEALELCRQFDAVLYVTDGHHRLAAAARVAAEEGHQHAYLPAGIFSAEELRVRSFARCIDNLKDDPAVIVAQLAGEHHLLEVDPAAARPGRRSEFGVGIAGRRYLLRLGNEEIPDDPYDSLDVNLLQDLILDPVFGIADPRRDRRLHFVADLSETSHLELDADAWFLPYPAAVTDVMAVADSGRVMPPKSTLFTPKLPAGLVIRPLDDP